MQGGIVLLAWDQYLERKNHHERGSQDWLSQLPLGIGFIPFNGESTRLVVAFAPPSTIGLCTSYTLTYRIYCFGAPHAG